MITIHKYQLIITDEQKIEMPLGAQILCVQMQGSTPCIWAKVDTDVPIKEFNIRIYGTGHKINECLNLTYIGTFQMHEGSLVFHAFLTK